MRYADLSLADAMLIREGRHMRAAFTMKPKAGDTRPAAAGSSTGTNVNGSMTDGLARGLDANISPELESLYRDAAAAGQGTARTYLHNDEEAMPNSHPPGTFTVWEPLPESELVHCEGLDGAVVTLAANGAQYPDLLAGVFSVVNLEWTQKIHRDRNARGGSAEAVTDVILRRTPDCAHYIVLQFPRTHVVFQRVPVAYTSNPFIACTIATADERLVIIRLANPHGFDSPHIPSMLHDSWMPRANAIVCAGGGMELTAQRTFTPIVMRQLGWRRGP